MLIWEILQQLQIQNLQSQQVSGASEAERAAGRTRVLSNEVQDRTGRVMLLTEAMWELMADRLGLTVTDLANRVREIQARNAQAAIANANAPQTRCSACKAVVPPGMTKFASSAARRFRAPRPTPSTADPQGLSVRVLLAATLEAFLVPRFPAGLP